MKPTRWARIHDRGDDLRHHLAAWDRAGFTRLLWAEFTKFRTVRAWMIALCAAAIAFVLLSFLSAFESRAPVPAAPTGPGGEGVCDTYMLVHRTLAGAGALTPVARGGLSPPPGWSPPAGPGPPPPGAPPPPSGQAPAGGPLPRRSWTPDPVAGFYPTVPSASTWQQRSAGAFTISGSGDIAPLVGDIISAQWAGASIVNGTIAALLFVIVLATLFATSEYRRGLIRTTFAASPRPGRC